MLATNSTMLGALTAKLRSSRLTCPLFDTLRWVISLLNSCVVLSGIFLLVISLLKVCVVLSGVFLLVNILVLRFFFVSLIWLVQRANMLQSKVEHVSTGKS